MDRATEAKTAVEESQRESRRLREEGAEQYIPRFFQQTKEGRWIPKFMYVYFYSCFLTAHLTRTTHAVYRQIRLQRSKLFKSGSGHRLQSLRDERRSRRSRVFSLRGNLYDRF